jgi:argininosuccinate lyase
MAYTQEDKEPIFDTADTVIDTLRIYADMLNGIEVRDDNMLKALGHGFATATDLADYLVKQGLPFRDAHEAVALAVRQAAGRGIDLAGFSLDELKISMASVPGATASLGADVFDVLTVTGALNARAHIGGTAPAQVRAAIARARKRLL